MTRIFFEELEVRSNELFVTHLIFLRLKSVEPHSLYFFLPFFPSLSKYLSILPFFFLLQGSERASKQA